MKGAFGIPRGFLSSEKIVFGFEDIGMDEGRRASAQQIRLADVVAAIPERSWD